MESKLKGISVPEKMILSSTGPETAPVMATQEAIGQDSAPATNLIPIHPTTLARDLVKALLARDLVMAFQEAPETAPVTATQEQVNERITLLYKECPFLFQAPVIEGLGDQPKIRSFKDFHSTALARALVEAFQEQTPVMEGSEDKAKIPTQFKKVPEAVCYGGDPFESGNDPFYINNFAAYHRERELEFSQVKPAHSKVERVLHCAEDGFVGATAYKFVKRDSTPFVYVHLGVSILIAVAKLGFRAFF